MTLTGFLPCCLLLAADFCQAVRSSGKAWHGRVSKHRLPHPHAQSAMSYMQVEGLQQQRDWLSETPSKEFTPRQTGRSDIMEFRGPASVCKTLRCSNGL